MFPADFFPKDYFPDPYFAANAGVIPPTTDTSGVDVTDAQRSPVVFASLSRPVIAGHARSPMVYDSRRQPMFYNHSTAPAIYHRGKP